MNANLLKEVELYVSANIRYFHSARIEKLRQLKLEDLLKRKNPYLYRAKNLNTPQSVVEATAAAYMISAEETMFGDWLEGLAIYIARVVYNGYKSSAEGIDIEMDKDGVHYFISVKSGPNWSNSSSMKKLRENFVKASRIFHTSGHRERCEGVEGCCYGKDLSPQKNDGHIKYCGQLFWEFISGEKSLNTDIIEPLGTEATLMNNDYRLEYDRMLTRFSRDFAAKYADADGNMLWAKIVELNSGYPDGFSVSPDELDTGFKKYHKTGGTARNEDI